MAHQEYESIASAIELTPKASDTFTITITPVTSNSIQTSTDGSKFPDTSRVIHENQDTNEYLEIPMTIEEKEAKLQEDEDQDSGAMYDEMRTRNGTLEETPEPTDYSVDEEKVHHFNKYTVCLDGRGPILTLDEIQTKKEEYLLETNHWKKKCPPQLLVVLCIAIGVGSYGIFLMIKSNFNNQLALILAGVSCAVIIIIVGLIIMKSCEKHEDFVEYYERSGNGLRFDTEAKSITTISFEIDYGYRPNKKGDKRFIWLHEAKITQRQTSKICTFDQVAGIGREIIKRRDKPDGYHIYINHKDKEFATWKSEMGVGQEGKSTFKELQSVMKFINEDWLNKITVKRDKIIKK